MLFQFTRKKLDELVHLSGQTIISLYLPTQKSGAGQQQNPIRFANQIKKAKERLEKSGLSTHKLKMKLDEAAKMGEAEAELWKYLKQGMAVFITEEAIEVLKLPMEVKEYALVDTHPFIKPLLPIITTNGKFYILTDRKKTLNCVDPKNGEVIWSGTLDAKVKLESSPTGADGKIFLMSHLGEVFVVQAGGDEFKLLNATQLGEMQSTNIRASIVPAYGNLFIRTDDKLFCIGE